MNREKIRPKAVVWMIRVLALCGGIVVLHGGAPDASTACASSELGSRPAIDAIAPAATTPDADSAGAWCDREPPGTVNVFVDGPGDSPVSRFEGSIVARRPPDALGLERIEIKDGAGRMRTLAFHAPGLSFPLRLGASYGFRVEFVGEAPHTCALVVTDRRGPCLIAVTDLRPGSSVSKTGVPGFDVELEPHRCPSRPHDECYDAIYNTTLQVARGKTAVRLHHGEAASLGEWRIHAFTAQEPVSSPRCADAAVPGVSYLIVRTR